MGASGSGLDARSPAPTTGSDFVSTDGVGSVAGGSGAIGGVTARTVVDVVVERRPRSNGTVVLGLGEAGVVIDVVVVDLVVVDVLGTVGVVGGLGRVEVVGGLGSVVETAGSVVGAGVVIGTVMGSLGSVTVGDGMVTGNVGTGGPGEAGGPPAAAGMANRLATSKLTKRRDTSPASRWA